MPRHGEATARKFERHDEAARKIDAGRLALRVDELCLEAVTGLSPQKIAEITKQWLAKAEMDPDDPASAMRFMEAMALAGYLTLFSPTQLGAPPIERFIRRRRPECDAEGVAALDALAAAEFRLWRFESCAAANIFRIRDLASGESLLLYDEDIPLNVLQVDTAGWLAPLPGGEFIAVGPLTPLDAETLAEGLSFVRPGRGLGNPRRCAAAVYRRVARHGGPQIEGLNALSEDAGDDGFDAPDESEWDDLDRLAEAFRAASQKKTPAEEEIGAARSMAGAGRIPEALARSVVSRGAGQTEIADAFAEIGFVMMETLDRRAAAGYGGANQGLAAMAAEIERAVERGFSPEGVRPLFEALRVRLTASRKAKATPGAESDELARVLQRIQALRAKTAAQGCTEQETLAAAKKVAELLDR